MDRNDIISNLAIQLAIKRCDDTPADAVRMYFELLPEIKQEFDLQRKQQPIPKATTANDIY